jgi:hypothetical protein
VGLSCLRKKHVERRAASLSGKQLTTCLDHPKRSSLHSRRNAIYDSQIVGTMSSAPASACREVELFCITVRTSTGRECLRLRSSSLFSHEGFPATSKTLEKICLHNYSALDNAYT